MKNLKDEFVMVPLKKEIANEILNLANKINVGPVEILNSGISTMLDIAKNNVSKINENTNSSQLVVPEKVEVAEECSSEEVKELLLEELKNVIKTAHTVDIHIHYN